MGAASRRWVEVASGWDLWVWLSGSACVSGTVGLNIFYR